MLKSHLFVVDWVPSYWILPSPFVSTTFKMSRSSGSAFLRAITSAVSPGLDWVQVGLRWSIFFRPLFNPFRSNAPSLFVSKIRHSRSTRASRAFCDSLSILSVSEAQALS